MAGRTRPPPPPCTCRGVCSWQQERRKQRKDGEHHENFPGKGAARTTCRPTPTTPGTPRGVPEPRSKPAFGG
eukprot:4917595-Prymnesium_polylepis.1